MATKKQRRNRIIAIASILAIFIVVGIIATSTDSSDSFFSEELGAVQVETTKCGKFCQFFDGLFENFLSVTVDTQDPEIGDTVDLTATVACPKPGIQIAPTVSSLSKITVSSPKGNIVVEESFSDSFISISQYLQSATLFKEISFTANSAGTYSYTFQYTCYDAFSPPFSSYTPASFHSQYETGFDSGSFNVEDVECTKQSVDMDCSGGDTSFVCDSGNVKEVVTQPTCENNMCSTDTSSSIEENCEFGCTNGQCDSEPTETFYRLESCDPVQIKPSQSTNDDFQSQSACLDAQEPEPEPTPSTEYWKIVDSSCISEDLQSDNAPSGYYETQSECQNNLQNESTYYRYKSSQDTCVQKSLTQSEVTDNDYLKLSECTAQTNDDNGNNKSGIDCGADNLCYRYDSPTNTCFEVSESKAFSTDYKTESLCQEQITDIDDPIEPPIEPIEPPENRTNCPTVMNPVEMCNTETGKKETFDNQCQADNAGEKYTEDLTKCEQEEIGVIAQLNTLQIVGIIAAIIILVVGLVLLNRRNQND